MESGTVAKQNPTMLVSAVNSSLVLLVVVKGRIDDAQLENLVFLSYDAIIYSCCRRKLSMEQSCGLAWYSSVKENRASACPLLHTLFAFKQHLHERSGFVLYYIT